MAASFRQAQPDPARPDDPSRARPLVKALGLFTLESLSTELVLAALGVASRPPGRQSVAVLFALAPLFLIHRSLSVPALQEEARVDPKTGLFNARHFARA